MDNFDMLKGIFDYIYFEDYDDEREFTAAVFNLSNEQAEEIHGLVKNKAIPEIPRRKVLQYSKMTNIILDYTAQDKCDREDLFDTIKDLHTDQILELYASVKAEEDPDELNARIFDLHYENVRCSAI